jgi:hypothetical protein
MPRITRRGLRLFAALLVLPALVLPGAAPAHAEDTEPVDREIVLADLGFLNGVRAVFTVDEISTEYGLLQQGQMGRNGPVAAGTTRGLLVTYLAITPRDVPVPERLLAEHPTGTQLPPELASRTIAPGPVFATDLAAPPAPMAVQGCFDTYYGWFDWHDPAAVGMAPKTYGSSGFGGKFHYTDSYVANCTSGPSYLWARHRIYYKNAFGNYVKHYESKVPPLTWEAKSKGSLVKRYRKVTYDDGWNSSPSCGSLTHPCRYTREGRFDD